MNRHTPMRVAYILKMYPRFSETFIVNEILAHEAAGVDVEIFSLRAPVDGRFHENYARIQAAVTYVPNLEPKLTQGWRDLHKAAQSYPTLWTIVQENPDLEAGDILQAVWIADKVRQSGVTHVHAHFASVATTVAWLVSRLTDIPYYFTAHAKDIFHESVNPADLRRKLAGAANIITVSDFNVAYLQHEYGEDASLVRRIYNGLDLVQFPYQPPTQRPRRIVAVGRLVEKKGFGDLIAACALLAERSCDFTCDIIGTGELKTTLQRQIHALGLERRVQLLGAQPQGAVIRHVQGAAVFAAPCVVGDDGNRDGLPTVLLEAMALGTPCISTAVTGIPEVVRHNATGLLVAEHDPGELAAAMQLLLEDPTLRVRLATTGRRLIEDAFDVHANASEIRRLYQAAAPIPEPVYVAG